MRLYIWEGHGISAAYHDDGTLVVLAETADAARQLIRREKAERERSSVERQRLMQELAERLGIPFLEATRTREGQEIDRQRPYCYDSDHFDGEDSALDREPDRVMETDKAAWVAFNGGDYD